MKKYKYVNVYMGKFIGAGSEEHRDIINQYAAKGYRYVGYIPTKISEYGKIKSMDLVFEIDENVEYSISNRCVDWGAE